MPAEQAQLQILKQLTIKPDSSQRELAQTLGISLGSVNYCLKALIEKDGAKWRKAARDGNIKLD